MTTATETKPEQQEYLFGDEMRKHLDRYDDQISKALSMKKRHAEEKKKVKDEHDVTVKEIGLLMRREDTDEQHVTLSSGVTKVISFKEVLEINDLKDDEEGSLFD